MTDKKPARAGGKPARIRAAVAYSGLQQGEIANAIGVSKSALARWMAGSSEGRAADDADLAKLAVACGVPLIFLELGFQEPSPDEVVDLRFRALEAKVDQLIGVLGSVPLDPDDAAAFIRILRENQMRAAEGVGLRELQSRRALGHSKESA